MRSWAGSMPPSTWRSSRRADLVIEAIPEDLTTKTEVFCKLDELNKNADARLQHQHDPDKRDSGVRPAGRRSSWACTSSTHRCLCPSIEVTEGRADAPRDPRGGHGSAGRLGKQVVVCKKDVPGFIVNRILGPLLNEAAWTVARGQATVEQVDSATVYKVGLPMGLFELADYTGIDVIYKAAEAVRSREPEPIQGRRSSRKSSSRGSLGRRRGRGSTSGPSVVQADHNQGTRSVHRPASRSSRWP